MKLNPIAKAILLRLRRQADDFAQQPVVKMTKAETMAFLDSAPVRVLDITPEFAEWMEQATHDIEAGHTVRLTGMSDEKLGEHWRRTLPVSDMSDEDFMALLVEANDRARALRPDGDRT